MHAYTLIALLHAASAMTSTLPTTTTPVQTPHILTSAEIVRRAPSQGSDRRPVVVLHGLLGQKRNFRSWAAQLSRALSHKRRIFCLDLRAHGDSFGGAAGMGYEAMAEDVERTLDGLGLEDCAVLGHSMGGIAAAHYAARHGVDMNVTGHKTIFSYNPLRQKARV